MLFQNIISPVPFRQWLWQDIENKRLILVALPVITGLLIWFKIDCPYPNFVDETYTYLQAAANNDFIHVRPISYSKYLQLLGFFSHSHLLPVVVQYLFLHVALLYFFFTVRYLLDPGKWLFRVLLFFTIINPLLLKLCNLLTPDALFTAFSLVWFTQLCRIFYKPSSRLLALHVLVVFLVFTLRHIAIYYPFISIAVIFLSKTGLRQRITASIGIILLFLAFIGAAQYTYYQKTGTTQFSALNGWEKANNALYGYAHGPMDSASKLPKRFRELHILVNRHVDSISHLRHRPDKELKNYYLEEKRSPLNIYLYRDTTNENISGATNRWLLMGALYNDYGDYVKAHHQAAWFDYYIGPNLINYFIPNPEYTGYYFPFGIIDSVAIRWFRLPNKTLNTYQEDKRIKVIKYIPTLFTLICVFFIFGIIGCAVSGGFTQITLIARKVLLCSLAVWTCYLVFSVVLAPVVLRQLVFILVVTYTFGSFLIVNLWCGTLSSYTRQNSNPKAFA